MPLRKKTLAISTLIVIAIFVISACGKADISAYANEKIAVTGLGEDFYITPEELSELECVSTTATGKSEKAGTVKAYGPELKTFVESRGYSLDDMKSIRFTAYDDYVVTLGRATWENKQVVMSISEGSSPLEEKRRPLRILIPGGDSGNWAYGVVKMEFNLKE